MKVEEIESTLQSENESPIQEKIILKICNHFESLYIFTLEKNGLRYFCLIFEYRLKNLL